MKKKRYGQTCFWNVRTTNIKNETKGKFESIFVKRTTHAWKISKTKPNQGCSTISIQFP